MRRLRILHVTPYFADAWGYGGIPRVASALVRGLARRGHDVTVCTTDACDAATRLPPQSGRRTAEGASIRVFRNVSNRLAYRQQMFVPVGLGSYLRRQAGTFDVAHLHACRNLPGVVAARYLRRAGVPYVVAPNGTAPKIERRLVAKTVFDALVGRRMLTGADCVLAVSGAERRQLRELGVPDSKVRMIPNPMDLDEFASQPRRGVLRAQFSLPAGPVVLFLGRQTSRKRVDLLVHAFARLGASARDASLVIAGNDGGSEDRTRALVRELGIDARTVFTGLLKSAERLEALADADVVVYPGELEIFGLVPLEALLLGVPVIVANDSGCGEVVTAIGGGQVVRAGDVDALSNAIRNVLDDLDHWKGVAAAAIPRVKQAYSAELICDRIERLYLEMRAAA